jgi:hypothetical protein
MKGEFLTLRLMHVYEVRPNEDHRGVDIISDALPFGRLWYGEPNAVANAIGYAQHPHLQGVPLFSIWILDAHGYWNRHCARVELS